MIANCGQLGLDWERVSLSGYLEALEAYNEAMAPEKRAPSAEGAERLAAVMAARSLH